MTGREPFASALIACLQAVALAAAPGANAALAGKPILALERVARTDVIEIARRGRGARIYLPLGPAYIYYDYPYYYSRGHYPTHVGGYVYYPSYGLSSRPWRGGPCSASHRRCVAGWSYERGPGPPRRQSARRN
jgi:hypothetical protein